MGNEIVKGKLLGKALFGELEQRQHDRMKESVLATTERIISQREKLLAIVAKFNQQIDACNEYLLYVRNGNFSIDRDGLFTVNDKKFDQKDYGL